MLLRQLAHAEKQLAHKETVMQRNTPGTSAHTRAGREANAYRERIAEYKRRLQDY